MSDKALEIFANTAQAMFVIAFFAYCLSPVWLPFVTGAK